MLTLLNSLRILKPAKSENTVLLLVSGFERMSLEGQSDGSKEPSRVWICFLNRCETLLDDPTDANETFG